MARRGREALTGAPVPRPGWRWRSAPGRSSSGRRWRAAAAGTSSRGCATIPTARRPMRGGRWRATSARQRQRRADRPAAAGALCLLARLRQPAAFMENVRRGASRSGDGRSEWTIAAPAGSASTLRTEVAEERAGELIAWRTLPGLGGRGRGAGGFRDAPGGRGTIVEATVAYGRRAARSAAGSPSSSSASRTSRAAANSGASRC